MRLILHNPNVETHFGITLLNFLTRTYGFKKYKYFLDYCVNGKNKVIIYIDNEGTSLPNYLAKFSPKLLETYLWCIINGINPFSVEITQNLNNTNDTDIFFSFTLGNLDKKNTNLEILSNKKFLKIFHLTHYVAKTSLIAKNLLQLKIDFLVAENNLRKNSKYFRRNFPMYKKDVYLLSFVFQDRFKNITPFSKRKNMCLATGTLINLTEFPNAKEEYADFLEFSPSGILQPGREEILRHKKELMPFIDNYIANFWETKRKEWSSKDTQLMKWRKRLFNAFFATKRDYMKFNIVEKYNQYKMFIVPEEAIDLPGIGFVEGMACGSVYIGKFDPMYTDLGLKPGIHYIGYDGTLRDLKRKINFYQKHPQQLEKIAKKGYEYVTKNFNGTTVARKFWEDLEKLAEMYKKNNYNRKKLQFKANYL